MHEDRSNALRVRAAFHVNPNVRVHVLAVVLALALFACFCAWLFDGLTCGGTGCR